MQTKCIDFLHAPILLHLAHLRMTFVYGMTTASLTIQLTSGRIIFDHAYVKITDMVGNCCDSVNICSAICYAIF